MSIGYHFVNAIFDSVNKILSPRVLISGYEKFGHVKMIEGDSFYYPSTTNSEESHFPGRTGSRLCSIKSRTGTGKTLSFLLPLEYLLKHKEGVDSEPNRGSRGKVKAIILEPTRELAT